MARRLGLPAGARGGVSGQPRVGEEAVGGWCQPLSCWISTTIFVDSRLPSRTGKTNI